MKIQNVVLVTLIGIFSTVLVVYVYNIGFNFGFGEGLRSVPSVEEPQPVEL